MSCSDADRLGPRDRAASLRVSAKQQASLMKAEARTIADRITDLEDWTKGPIPARLQQLEDSIDVIEVQQQNV